MHTSEFVGEDHVVHVVDCSGNIFPPIAASGFLKSKMIPDRSTDTEDMDMDTLLRTVRHEVIKASLS
jgi:hypothetical protein